MPNFRDGFSYKKHKDHSSPHRLALSLPEVARVSDDGLRTNVVNGPSLQSVSSNGAPLRMCWHCNRPGSFQVGSLITKLGRKVFAHNDCEDQARIAREARRAQRLLAA
jgi:hypothetical protein